MSKNKDFPVVFRILDNGIDEILIFNADGDGEDNYFKKGGRNYEDYDLTIAELPFCLSSKVNFESEREHEVV